MSPDFDRLLISGIGFGPVTLAFIGWRFGCRPGRGVQLAGLQ